MNKNVKVSGWSSQEFGCSFYLVLMFVHFFPRLVSNSLMAHNKSHQEAVEGQ